MSRSTRGAVTVARRFPAACRSVGEARHFLVEQIGGCCHRDVELLALMVSELATNAVQHAGTEFEVAVTMTPDAEGCDVLVRVTDEGPGFCALRVTPADAPHGRGLRIVESLAGAWGVEEQSGRSGKTVWFTARVESASVAGGAARREVTDQGEEDGPAHPAWGGGRGRTGGVVVTS